MTITLQKNIHLNVYYNDTLDLAFSSIPYRLVEKLFFWSGMSLGVPSIFTGRRLQAINLNFLAGALRFSLFFSEEEKKQFKDCQNNTLHCHTFTSWDTDPYKSLQTDLLKESLKQCSINQLFWLTEKINNKITTLLHPGAEINELNASILFNLATYSHRFDILASLLSRVQYIKCFSPSTRAMWLEGAMREAEKIKHQDVLDTFFSKDEACWLNISRSNHKLNKMHHLTIEPAVKCMSNIFLKRSLTLAVVDGQNVLVYHFSQHLQKNKIKISDEDLGEIFCLAATSKLGIVQHLLTSGRISDHYLTLALNTATQKKFDDIAQYLLTLKR